MKQIQHAVSVKNRSQVFRLYPLGDLHIGARACAEDCLRNHVARIAADDNARWVGGGDLIDAVSHQDLKRYDPRCLPDWLFEAGDSINPADTIRDRMANMVRVQADRCIEILEPIKDKCLGLIEGNHEYSILKYHGWNPTDYIAEGLGTVNLTDSAILRLSFRHRGNGRVVSVWIEHGNGGGRTRGSEPNHLGRLLQKSTCNVALRGHSHTFHILPPDAVIESSTGERPNWQERWAGNWGTFYLSYAHGSSTYGSRAGYPPRPLWTCYLEVISHRGASGRPIIELKALDLSQT